MLRDRYDLIDPIFTAQEQKVQLNAQQPYGGDSQRTFGYDIVAIRVDNYTNRWLLVSNEGFVVPPFVHGFIINLFVTTRSLRIQSVRSPFSPIVTGTTVDLNPKQTSHPFPTKVLISIYDTPQAELTPVSLVRVENAMMEPVPQISGLIQQLHNAPAPLTLGNLPENTFPQAGSLMLPVISAPIYYENGLGGRANVQARAPSGPVGGKVTVPANVFTSIPDADQPQPFQGNGVSQTESAFCRLLRMVVSCSVAGIVDLRDQFNLTMPGSQGGFFSADMSAHSPIPVEFGDAGYLLNFGTPPGINVLQFRHSAGADITYTLVYGVGQ